MEKNKKISLEEKVNDFKEASVNVLKNVVKVGAFAVVGTAAGCLIALPLGAIAYPIVAGIQSAAENQEYFKSFLDKDTIKMGLAMYGVAAGCASGTFIANFIKEEYF
jgi:hypothetical protein